MTCTDPGKECDQDGGAREIDERGRSRSKSKELHPEVRHGKRRSYVEAIKGTPGYEAYLARKKNGDEKTVKIPGTPDASDKSLSKRQWDEACRKWRNALKEFGDIPYEPHDIR